MNVNPPEPSDIPLLTPGEVARIFRVNPKTVARWANAGKLTYRKTPGGVHRFYAPLVWYLASGTPTITYGYEDSSAFGWSWKCLCHDWSAGQYASREDAETGAPSEHERMAEKYL